MVLVTLREDPAVLRYLRAKNDWTAQATAHLGELRTPSLRKLREGSEEDRRYLFPRDRGIQSSDG